MGLPSHDISCRTPSPVMGRLSSKPGTSFRSKSATLTRTFPDDASAFTHKRPEGQMRVLVTTKPPPGGDCSDAKPSLRIVANPMPGTGSIS